MIGNTICIIQIQSPILICIKTTILIWQFWLPNITVARADQLFRLSANMRKVSTFLEVLESLYIRGCQRCNFVLQSALNCLNLKWSKKAILEVATSNLQKWPGSGKSWGPCMPIWHPLNTYSLPRTLNCTGLDFDLNRKNRWCPSS